MPDPTAQAADDAVRTIVGDEPLARADIALSAIHVPGSALETQADAEASRARESEPVLDTVPPVPPRVPDTTTPEANLATRDNIVSDGPGTVGN